NPLSAPPRHRRKLAGLAGARYFANIFVPGEASLTQPVLSKACAAKHPSQQIPLIRPIDERNYMEFNGDPPWRCICHGISDDIPRCEAAALCIDGFVPSRIQARNRFIFS